MKKSLICIFLFCFFTADAQFTVHANRNEAWKKQYRAFATKINDLVHTKLDVKFDYDKSYLYGKAWITLKPHFYSTDSLNLDAKGMDIKEVALVNDGRNIPLKYQYDSLNLRIQLDKTYSASENYTIYIDYVSKPNEFKGSGSAAITDAKGLYFINPGGTEKNKPTQIWTQGETEATSVWCPTIDRPNQKTTQEISMTVPAKYVTLSNGLLVDQKQNNDGSRTDTWKMDKPNAPYLFFMGVGDFAIIRDAYKEKEVSYYVEKEYASVARKIFGLTPEMIGFFSNITGVDFPWSKYSQMTGRDYVSGAMENTTATLHTSALQQNARQLTDGNKYEDYISHELFHQWFGDLVTLVSWSNLTVNESFADYSEYLWREYKYGKEDADQLNYTALQGYLSSGNDDKDLVRFYYRDKEDMFDAVSYNKGGRILHMLRNYLGDSAFFKGLNLYLNTYKYGNADANQLRLALEQVCGKDLNWFFNQWYFGSGQPTLDISYKYDSDKQMAHVFMKQIQPEEKVFKLPFSIDIYEGNAKKRYQVWMNHEKDTFSFKVQSMPELINVDAEKILLARKQDHKTLEMYLYQYKNAGNYVDKIEALEYCSRNINNPDAKQLLLSALDDPFYGIREYVLHNLSAAQMDKPFIAKIEQLAKTDAHKLNRAQAIQILGELKNTAYKDLFLKNINDSSYNVAGAALLALFHIDEKKAISLLPELKKDARENLRFAIDQVELITRSDTGFEEMYNRFIAADSFSKFSECYNLIIYLSKVENTARFKKGFDAIIKYRDQVALTTPELKKSINKDLAELKHNKEKIKAKGAIRKALAQQIAYMDQKLKN